jgi:flagellar hook-basal body complex protein FliE
VADLQTEADASMNNLAVGRGDSLHETMIAVEQANIAFKMMMAVRSKVINAYHEVMRMQF